MKDTVESIQIVAFANEAVGRLVTLASQLNPLDRRYVGSCMMDSVCLDRDPLSFKFGSNYMASLLDMEDSVGVLFRSALERRRGGYVIETSPQSLSIDEGSRAAFLDMSVEDFGQPQVTDHVEVGAVARRAMYGERDNPDLIVVDGQEMSRVVGDIVVQAVTGCEPEDVPLVREIVQDAGGYGSALRQADEYALLARLADEELSELKDYAEAVVAEQRLERQAKAEAEQKQRVQAALDSLGIDFDNDVIPVIKGFKDGQLQIVSVIDRPTHKSLSDIIDDAVAVDPEVTVLHGVAVSGAGHLLAVGDKLATIYIEKQD